MKDGPASTSQGTRSLETSVRVKAADAQSPHWIFTAALLGVMSIMTLIAYSTEPPAVQIKVAFVGNSMQYVNDLPRFMQALAGRKRARPQDGYLIQQNACLHGSLNFQSQLEYGNGMYWRWKTKKAEIRGFDPKAKVYDYGACTVPQLITGYDEKFYDMASYYINDTKNPCMMSRGYYNYTLKHYQNIQPNWDYIVMNDNTKWPALEETRESSLQTLEESYVPMLLESGGIPILYATHGYRSDVINVTGFGNVSSFTSDVFEGYRQYADLLAANLPDEQQPRIAPVGLAFLVVYEENYNLWRRLFYVDGVHPSPSGSYLIGCILYATLYGHMPRRSIALPPKPKVLWKRARSMETNPRFYMPYPTQTEAAFLFHVAKRIMIQGYRPETWIKYHDESVDNEYIGKWR